MDTLRSVKDVTNKVLETARLNGAIGSSLEAELTLQTNSEPLTSLLSKHHVHEIDSTSTGDAVEFSLADLLTVSKMTVNEEDEVSDQDGCYSVSEEVDCDGELVGVEALVRRASRSGKHKCPRCWKWTCIADGALCSRCQLVIDLQ
jgi:isoleucyl-tRNA synthetase